MTDQRYFRLVNEKKHYKGGSNTHELTGSCRAQCGVFDHGREPSRSKLRHLSIVIEIVLDRNRDTCRS